MNIFIKNKILRFALIVKSDIFIDCIKFISLLASV